MSLLNILICHTPNREHYLKRLMDVLTPQLTPAVKILIDDSTHKTIGKKRNDLVFKARCKYAAFIDDDDLVSPNYVKLLLEGIAKDVDCCSLVGEITWDGENPRKFIHSRQINLYFERDGVYYRPPNHLNCIKTEISKQFLFPHKNFSEDTDWAMQICRAGILRTEHVIEETIYYYEYRSNK